MNRRLHPPPPCDKSPRLRLVRRPADELEPLAAERRVWIYVPPQYEEEDYAGRRFPVLYMQDGQNVFDGATAFLAGNEWRADETAERVIGQGRIEPRAASATRWS